MKVTAYLSLGSNKGDRMQHLSEAENALKKNAKIEIRKLSQIYETELWPKDRGVEAGEQWFLNQVLEIETRYTPQELLAACQTMEKNIGRTFSGHWGSREIDIDILLYGDGIVETDDLHLPHRHMTDRQFVLVPLLEIAPDLTDPATGKPYRYFLENISDEHKVTPFL
jgi:2-amino-4-hydroxy-6-hydroxymethyldihydropteridine diphosphokinase